MNWILIIGAVITIWVLIDILKTLGVIVDLLQDIEMRCGKRIGEDEDDSL